MKSLKLKIFSSFLLNLCLIPISLSLTPSYSHYTANNYTLENLTKIISTNKKKLIKLIKTKITQFKY